MKKQSNNCIEMAYKSYLLYQRKENLATTSFLILFVVEIPIKM